MADEYLKVIIKLTPNVSKGQTGTAETCVLGERSGAVSKGTREGHGQLLRHLYGRVVTAGLGGSWKGLREETMPSRKTPGEVRVTLGLPSAWNRTENCSNTTNQPQLVTVGLVPGQRECADFMAWSSPIATS